MARIVLILPFFALATRAGHLSVDERGSARGEKQIHQVLRLAPERGVIFDSSGAALGLSVEAPSIYANPADLEDVEKAARQLATALNGDRRALAKRLKSTSSFAFVSRWVTDEQARRVADLGLAGIGVLSEPRRVYPNGKLAAQVIGFANIDGVGVRGIEQQEDAWLRGNQRRLAVERDARGRLLVDAGGDDWSTAGGDIALTIDAAVQADAEAALDATVAATGARSGIAISMDPHTGDILALAETPGFDPNRFRELDYRTTRLRSFLDAADPGSTMKAFLVAAALDNAAVAPNERFDCENGTLRVSGSVIHDSHPHAVLSVSEILQLSSNIGAAKIAFALGPQAHFEALRRFGFGQITGIGFPGESAGLLRAWQRWRSIDHATIAFGQGLSVTPIQLAAAAAALANGGRWVRPRLVAARRAARGPWQPSRIEEVSGVIRPETAAAVRLMMEGVVGPNGTGKKAALRGVRVAGKTGTAQKFDPATGTYANDRFSAWFIGIVPADDPKLVIVAGVDEPRRPSHTGGAAAAPLFARVASAQLARFGIFTEPESDGEPPPFTPETPTLVASADVPENPTMAAPAAPWLAAVGDRVLLPDFVGLTASEVKRITQETFLDVEMTGRGRAVAQEPPAGTILSAGEARVVIRFERSEPRGVQGEG